MLDLETVWVTLWSQRGRIVWVKTAGDLLRDNLDSLRAGEKPDWMVVAISDDEEEVRAVAARFQSARNAAEDRADGLL